MRWLWVFPQASFSPRGVGGGSPGCVDAQRLVAGQHPQGGQDLRDTPHSPGILGVSPLGNEVGLRTEIEKGGHHQTKSNVFGARSEDGNTKQNLRQIGGTEVAWDLMSPNVCQELGENSLGEEWGRVPTAARPTPGVLLGRREGEGFTPPEGWGAWASSPG